MDFQKLHNIDENLTSDDVAHLKFLCMDLVSKKRLETVDDAKELFKRLNEQLLLENRLLLPELLITIGRLDLLDILGTSKEEVERYMPEHISPYRKMLFRIYEDMTEENISSVKFLLNLPRSKIGTSASFLDMIIELEKQQRLSEGNLDELYNILNQCDKQLAERIQTFRNILRDQEQGGSRPMQEESNNGDNSLSDQLQSMTVDEGRRDSLVTDSDILTDDYYQLTQKPLGHCLIINNYDFEKKTSLYFNRNGTEKDKEELRNVFRRMRFEIEVKDDLEASQMRDVIKEFAKKDHSEMGAFVCCVLSHGEKGSVLGVDGKPVEIRELTLPIAECRTLTSKPKLFFIQACQGKEAQDGVWAKDGQNNDTEEGTYEEDARIADFRSIPVEADFLIGMATVEHFQSFRHTKQGSIYIQELCRQLKELCPRREDILSILTKVNYNVSIKILNGHKQMPEPRYTLTKKLILPID